MDKVLVELLGGAYHGSKPQYVKKRSKLHFQAYIYRACICGKTASLLFKTLEETRINKNEGDDEGIKPRLTNQAIVPF